MAGMLLMCGVAGASLAAITSNFGKLEDFLVALVPKASGLGVAGERLAIRMPLGFVAGVITWYILSWSLLFLRIRIIRLLLTYNHWFIEKRPNSIDYVSIDNIISRDLNQRATYPFHFHIQVWATCLKLLLSNKNLGIRGYQDMLPSLPVPPLKATCSR